MPLHNAGYPQPTGIAAEPTELDLVAAAFAAAHNGSIEAATSSLKQLLAALAALPSDETAADISNGPYLSQQHSTHNQTPGQAAVAAVQHMAHLLQQVPMYSSNHLADGALLGPSAWNVSGSHLGRALQESGNMTDISQDVPSGPSAFAAHVVGASRAEPLALVDLLLAAAVLLVPLLLSISFSLKLHARMLAATTRCAVQLLLLGLLLSLVFAYAHWWLVLIYAAVFMVVASIETVSRPRHTYQGMLTHVLLSILLSVTLCLVYSLLLLVTAPPWWRPQSFLVLLGMLLIGAVSGTSAGLSTVLQELVQGRSRLEFMLSMGASRWETLKPVLQQGLQAALGPMLASLQVMGVVGIPELMMGQLLTGTSPNQAARYQILIAFLALVASCLAVSIVTILAALTILDNKLCLQVDKLTDRGDRPSGIEPWLAAQLLKGWHAFRDGQRRFSARLRVTFWPSSALGSATGGSPPRPARPHRDRRTASWVDRVSMFTRYGRRKFKRSSQQESLEFEPENVAMIDQLQDNIMSDEESFLSDNIHLDALAAQPLLPTNGVP